MGSNEVPTIRAFPSHLVEQPTVLFGDGVQNPPCRRSAGGGGCARTRSAVMPPTIGQACRIRRPRACHFLGNSRPFEGLRNEQIHRLGRMEHSGPKYSAQRTTTTVPLPSLAHATT